MITTTNVDNKGISDPKIDSHLGIIGGSGLKREIGESLILLGDGSGIITSSIVKNIFGVQVTCYGDLDEDSYDTSECYIDFTNNDNKAGMYYNYDTNGREINNIYGINIVGERYSLTGDVIKTSNNSISISLSGGTSRIFKINAIFIGI